MPFRAAGDPEPLGPCEWPGCSGVAYGFHRVYSPVGEMLHHRDLCDEHLGLVHALSFDEQLTVYDRP